MCWELVRAKYPPRLSSVKPPLHTEQNDEQARKPLVCSDVYRFAEIQATKLLHRRCPCWSSKGTRRPILRGGTFELQEYKLNASKVVYIDHHGGLRKRLSPVVTNCISTLDERIVAAQSLSER
jgi:hypothetical protein